MSNTVDFSAKKTEAGGIEALDDFFIKATPQWFEWLEWVAIIAVIRYVGEQADSIPVKIIALISSMALFYYLQAFFYSVRFVGLPLIKPGRGRRTASLVISGILTIGTWILLSQLFRQLEGQV